MLVCTLIRRDFGLGCRKLGLGGLKLRLRFRTLGDQLRRFQLSNTLACFDPRSSIDGNGLHKPGHLGEDGYDFIGLNLAWEMNRDGKFLRDYPRDLNLRTRVRGCSLRR